MADYIYMMETRLTPEQQRGVALVQDIARAEEMNVYLAGGAVRDMISGFPIRDLDFVVQGNPLKFERALEKAGAEIEGKDEELRVLYVRLPGKVRAEIAAARSEKYDKPGKPPEVRFETINEDLRRRDFTANAMALSLNPGSRGLLLDPFNGVADISPEAETKYLRVLHNYAFLEEPSRLIRAVRFQTRFHWQLEERTQARFNTAVENNYIDYLGNEPIGRELEQFAYEEDPLASMRALEKQGWMKLLHPHWNSYKADTADLQQMQKLRTQLQDLGYNVDASAIQLYFLTAKLPEGDTQRLQRAIPRQGLVRRWKALEDEAKELAKRLTSKEAAQPSQAWKLLSDTPPEKILFLALTTRQGAVEAKVKNWLTKWRQMKQRLPFPEMAELRITPELPVYQKIMDEAFLMLLDGKLRSQREILKYLKPYEPPPPPPPPPPRRGRAKAAEAEAAAPGAEAKGKGRKAKGALETIAKAAAGVAGAVAGAAAAAKEAVRGKGKGKAADAAAPKSAPVVNAEVKPATKSAKPAAKPGPRKAAASKPHKAAKTKKPAKAKSKR
jgi:tRNA nucleotidyltransferase (CCA-adding enzyme)